MRIAWLMLVLLNTLVFPSPSQADDLGRLFFTPEQRAMLDLARRSQSSATQPTDTGSDGVTLSGVVTRSDGRQTVWINGRPQRAGAATSRSPSAASIPLPGGGQVRMRVGQTLDPTSGKVEEGYRRPRPAAVPEKALPPAAATPSPAPRSKQLPPAPDGGDDGPDDEPAPGTTGR